MAQEGGVAGGSSWGEAQEGGIRKGAWRGALYEKDRDAPCPYQGSKFQVLLPVRVAQGCSRLTAKLSAV